MVSQAHSQYNQRSPSHNSGIVERSLTVQPVCRNRTINRINGNKSQDVVVKSMEHNVNKNKSNEPRNRRITMNSIIMCQLTASLPR